jgi:hypothetical protein
LAGGDLNLYRYCRNNPVNWVDMWGLEEEDPLRDYGKAWGKNAAEVGALSKQAGIEAAKLTGEVAMAITPWDKVLRFAGRPFTWAGKFFTRGKSATTAVKCAKNVSGATESLKHLDDVLDEAARLEKQWPRRIKALEESGEILNMAKKADVKYIDYLQRQYKFGNESRELLHEMITKQNLSKKQIAELAQGLKGGK